MNSPRAMLVAMALAAITVPAAHAAPLDQYASVVIDFSSQWSTAAWAAVQATGEPDTFAYGDILTAWAPVSRDGSLEYITLGFDTPVHASGAVIRETFGNGFVYQVDVLDTDNVLHTVFAGTDTSLPGDPVEFNVEWALTPFLVQGLKIYTNTDHDLNAWEEIDSVLLRGDTTAPVPVPGAAWLMGPALAGLAALGRRRRG